MQIQPYVFFDGRCEEAIEFYRGALGADVTMLMRFKEGPGPVSHGTEDKVMHAIAGGLDAWQDIEQALGLSKSTVFRAIAALRSDGLVAQKTPYRLTPEGEEATGLVDD